MMIKSKKGFSLIELLIVIAIIGVLAALAVPKYRQYTLRAKFVDVMNSLNPHKQDLSVCAVSAENYLNCYLAGNDGTTQAITTTGVSDAKYVQSAFQYRVEKVGAKAATPGAAGAQYGPNPRTGSGDSVILTAHASAAFDNGGTDRTTYSIVGTIQNDGSQYWAVSSDTTDSNCLARGLCTLTVK